MIKPERGEFIPWKTALFGAALAGFLLAGAFLAPVEKSFATPAAEPPKASDSAPEEAGEDSEEDSEAPEPEAEEPRPYLVLPYRSPERACQFARTVIRRHVLTLGYSSREEGPRTPGDPSPDGLKPCAEALMGPEDKRAQDFYRWSFGKLAAGESAETLRRRLSLELHPFPAGGFELYMFGEQRPPTAVEGEAERPAGENPDLLGLMTGGQELLADLQAAPLGGPFDRYFTYPLSYIQSDRAVAMLETLGYSVITYSRAAEAEEGSSVFETERGEGSYDRPVVIRMIDSEVTSLVTGELGNKTGLEGGQALSGVTDAVPQQRLLIVYDERDTPSLDSLLARLQGEIDVAARQILMEAMVLEIDRERLFELGFDFDGADGRWSTSFEEGADGVVNPFVFSWTSTAASSAFDFMASLTALENDGSARVLSRPSILVLDGRQARIKIAEEIPFSGRLEIGQDDLRIQETRFLTAGIILNLRPRATFDNREVSMQVEAIISSAGPSRVQSGTGVLIAPNVQSRQVQTLVRVKNDTPFVIGGLISEQSQDSQAGVPWLMRIPWLGQLFRKDNVSRDSREVIVVITPHIVLEDDESLVYTVARDSENFDSFGAELFHNTYRLRSGDVFDTSFITENTKHRENAEIVRACAKGLTQADLEFLPPVEGEQLIAELERRMDQKMGAELEPEALDTFLRLFSGGVPGEEILVHRMLIEVLENQDFDSQVPLEKMLVLVSEESENGKCLKASERAMALEGGGVRTLYLAESECYQSCLVKDGKTLSITFPKAPEGGGTFAPPVARLECGENVGDDKLLTEMRKSYLAGTPKLLLNRDFKGRRKPAGSIEAPRQDSLALLQSVLALERLLEMNDARSFPRTLETFHSGRQVIFPSREDLQSRTYVLNEDTAALYYETLDYYTAFGRTYDQKWSALERSLGDLCRPCPCETEKDSKSSACRRAEDGACKPP